MNRGLASAIVLLAGVVAAAPLAWAVAVATRLGEGPTLAAFAKASRELPLATWLINGLVIAGTQTLVAAAACSAVGFALRFYRFRGRLVVVAVLGLTALLPAPAAVVGLFEVVAWMGGVDTLWAATLPGAFGAFGVFVYVAAMRSVSASTLEAARLDGCGEAGLWWRIALPAVRPATGAFVLLHFLGAWNAVLWPAAVLADDAKRPVAVGLAEASASVAFEADPSLAMAAALVALAVPGGLFVACAGDLLRGRDEKPRR